MEFCSLGMLYAGIVAVMTGAGTARLDELFASWQRAQRDVRSLVVEFTEESRDHAFNQKHQSEGTLTLIRTPNGEIRASYELRPKDGTDRRFGGLLLGKTVIVLDHAKKKAYELPPQDEGTVLFLARWLNPFVLMLNNPRARKELELSIVGQDRWYTYLQVVPSSPWKQQMGFTARWIEGRVVLMNEASRDVPKNMPRQLWYSDGTHERTFDIRSWRLNAANGPGAEALRHPRDWPGWEFAPYSTLMPLD
jgi:hypothetical protein